MFSVWTFHLVVSKFQQHLHIQYMSVDAIVQVLFPTYQGFSVIESCYWSINDSMSYNWSNHLKGFTAAIINVTEYLCHTWPIMFSVYRSHNDALSTFMTDNRLRFITGFVARVPPWIPLAGYKPPTLPEHLSSLSSLLACCSIILSFSVVFCGPLLYLWYFWLLYCVSFFDGRFLITTLVSSNIYYVFTTFLSLV